MKQTVLKVLYVVMAFAIAAVAGAAVFFATHSQTTRTVDLPDVFPQPCVLSALCVIHAQQQAGTQVTPTP